ncbi:SDR family oxidoreductase [Parvularcula sp. ZS-1/3]|uniref:SDR family oxidoreductase n=1 Tax=Parvularcula mediterranea TaxID=2732508 RepID=A0A7Y3RJM6_9PROT|nr:SDR family oxidoreductase [Parvularcula mediterranea]NNU15302.1 SDR family oxidoreductase [Parvularcula mediterranea]
MTKAVLVTGGGKRLGREIVLTAAEAGWTPVVHYNSSSNAAEELAKETGGVAVGIDLSEEGAGEKLIALATEKLGGKLTGLVNSASIFEHDTGQDVTEEALLRNFRIHTVAPAMLAKAFAHQASDGSAIVNILDQKLFNLNADHYSYTISKQALHGATMMMARAYAPSVRAIGVAPGYNLPSPGQDDETFERLAPTVNVLERRLQPRDVAKTVLFALENMAITGQVLIASGGEHLKSAERDVLFKD